MSNYRAIAADLGTMFFQVASVGENDQINIKTTRNAFVELAGMEDIEDILKQNKWQYVKDGDKYYVIGEDSLRVAKMFPGKVELRRPLQDGVLNRNEDKKMLILAELIESSVGKAPDENSLVCFCISSPSVDGSADSTFHKSRLTGMFKRLGWDTKVIEEGMAVILSERPTMIEPDGNISPYSGVGISMGAGRINCVLAYKGLQIIGMSCARAGDWIDKKVSEQTDTPLSQVTSKKERYLDFDNLDYDDDVIFALDAYYTAAIEFVFSHFSKKFSEVKSQFDAPLDIIVAGGTATPKGFCKKIEEVIKGLDLPFEVKSIRIAADPVNSVVKGCLIQALLSQKKLGKENKIEEIQPSVKTENLSDILGE